jgi:hypothetical protein
MISVLELKYNDCIVVNTGEECDKLFKIFHTLGLTWQTGESYIGSIGRYHNIEKPMYLRPRKGSYGDSLDYALYQVQSIGRYQRPRNGDSLDYASSIELTMYQVHDIIEYNFINNRNDNLKNLLEC